MRSLVFAFIALSVAAFSLLAQEEVVAMVNGEPITKAELEGAADTVGIVLAIYRQYPGFARALLGTEEGKAFLRAYERLVLEDLIRWKLILQEAERRGIEVDEGELELQVEKTFRDILARNDLTEEELAQILERQGREVEGFRGEIASELRRRMLADALKDLVTAGLGVAEEEIIAYYEGNREEFTDEQGNKRPLEEVREGIAARLLAEKRDRVWEDWLQATREAAEVEIYF